jgi:hypothetical protein
VHDLGELAHPHLASRAAAQPLEDLELDRREVVLLLELVLQRRVDGGVGGVERAPGLDGIGGSSNLWHAAHPSKFMLQNQF